MTGARLLPLDVTKEIRAQLPVWLACMTTIGAAAILSSGRALPGVTQGTVLRVGILAYVFGCAALGAFSIGHEYSNRTLPLLLSLPASRRRLFTVKLTVLTAMLLGLSVVAMAGVLDRLLRGGLSDAAVVGLLSFLGGLFLAPWLTMVCRNPLAGAVFATVIGGSMLAVGEVVAILTYGASLAHTRDADGVKLAVASWGMLMICAAAAVASWRMFMRLEAIDGRDSHMRLPRWLRHRRTAAAPDVVRLRRLHPVWLLTKKELHLQHLTLVVAGLYVLGWLSILLLGRAVAGPVDQPLVVLTAIFGVAVAMLSGSIASAEERQFGTLESQVLLPMAMAKQWAVKSGVVVGLAVLLAIGLPILLGYIGLPAEDLRINPWYLGMVVIVAAGSLYVSSLCSSGLRALLMSPPVFLAVLVLFNVLGPAIQFYAPPMLGLATVFVVLVLRFGLVNHRSSERGAARIWRQVIWMAGSLALGVVIFAGAVSYFAGSVR